MERVGSVLVRPVEVEVVRSGIAVCPTWPHPIRREHLRRDLTAREFDRDFVQRLATAEAIKAEMRRGYCARRARQPKDISWANYWPDAEEFWSAYEEINLLWVPEDPVYSGTRSAIALVAASDWWTLTLASNTQVRILESFIAGEATVSTVSRTNLNVSTSGTTPTEATEVKFNSRSATATALFRTGWSVQPTAGSAAILHALNSFGGADRFVPQPGAEIYLVNAEQLSNRQEASTAACSGHVIWEEL